MWIKAMIVPLVALGLLSTQPSQAAAPSWSCYGELAAVLKKNNFPGPDCNRAFVKIRYAGKIHSGRKLYLIYHYHYEDNPKFLNGRQQHSINRILIFENDKKHFLGEYTMSDGFETTVIGNHIHVLTHGEGFTQDIWFGPNGPPDKVILGGDETGFGR